MEKKLFDEYSLEEKESLLMHWWYYYGKLLVNLDEIERFHGMVLTDPHQIYKCAVVSYILGYSSQGIVEAMRSNEIDKYFENINSIWEKKEFEEIRLEVESAFVEEIVGTYNEPEANVPMSDEEIASQVISMVKDKNTNELINADAVRKLYRNCLLTDEEVKDDMPIVDFILGEGVMTVSVFNSERIENAREKINLLFNAVIPNAGQIMSFLDLCVDCNGSLWTGEHSTVDLLVQLGVATGEISYLVPRKEWKSLPGEMPFVVRNKVKEDSKVNSHKPHEYTKVIDDFRKNNL